MNSSTRGLAVLFGLALALVGCQLSEDTIGSDPTPSASSSPQFIPYGQGQQLYTAYNIWYDKVDTLAAVNFKVGALIPAGTEVTEVGLLTRRFHSDAIVFTTVSSGVTYTVSFNARLHPGQTIQDYQALMFTEKNFDQLTAGFTAGEVDAIRKGLLTAGMSREAVLVAYGYPPEHATISLETSPWKYWTSRFQDKLIHFDANGRTCAAPAEPEGP